MNVFFKQTMTYYIALHNKHEIFDGHELERFTVFIDIKEGYLAYQIYYFDETKERVILDFEPEKGRFMLFDKAYLEVEAIRKGAKQSITFHEVIEDMESRFMEYAVSRGYRKEILFSLFYVPFFIDSSDPLFKKENTYRIPYELLIKAENTVLKN